MKTLDPTATEANSSNTKAAIDQASKRLAPLWPLQNFVAVNPFLGLSETPFINACQLIHKVAPGGMQMPLKFYAKKFSQGEITTIHLAAALDHASSHLPEPWSTNAKALTTDHLTQALEKPEPNFSQHEITTVADTVDRHSKTNWAANITEVIAQFCAGYYDIGQSAWRQPWRGLPLYHAWLETASIDAKPEMYGLTNFRKHVASLPADHQSCIEYCLKELAVTEPKTTDFLHRQLMSIRGWAGHVQYLVRENGMAGKPDDSLQQLLAIRLAYDVALLKNCDIPNLDKPWQNDTQDSNEHSPQVLTRLLWQLAHENAAQRNMAEKLAPTQPAASVSRPSAQAVFCIDVRSEIFRRSLESAAPNLQTMGFAGFFAMSIERIPFGQHQGDTQCPALLTPSYRIRENPKGADEQQKQLAWKQLRLDKRLSFSWNAFKHSAISCFSFVESAGIGFGPKLFINSYAPKSKKHNTSHCPDLTHIVDENTGIPAADRIALAIGALTHMGLKSNFARLVLLCGHGSETTNNPYSSGLDCGACGGHAGDSNARVAAQILNDPEVRTALIDKGIEIPADTLFLAGLHNTTTDQVTVFETESIPETHHNDLQSLQQALAHAGNKTRLERASSLGLNPNAENLNEKILSRALDWAEVRPEWGLAGNAAFVVAPRARTKNINFGGRVFLHDYNHATDTNEATLELIMIAPMVVGSWINLQYYASTVNNEIFGSGNKVTHNVTSTIGVCQGNAGDLQTGLPIQSVHDGEKWIHEPLRLHVYIEAPRASLAAVLEKHKNVRDLVTNGWIILTAIEDEGRTHHCHLPDGNWQSTKISKTTKNNDYES